MNDEYLWDRSGPPDPEVERLEGLLGALRHRGAPPAQRPRRYWAAAAAAAAVVIALLAWRLAPRPAAQKTTWELVAGGQPRPLYTGQVLRTDRASRLILESAAMGRIEVAPDSELRMLEAAPARHRLGLSHGLIHVLIWAPPRQFVVDTPSARAVDLGCQYSLSVDSAGDALLAVQTGWVAFQYRRLESFIPAGAACMTRKGRGPGTPYFDDASQLFRRSLEAFDQSSDPAALRRVLAESRLRDALTLWHLLTRAPQSERGAVFDRFAQLVPLPPQVTRQGVLANNPPMLDLCWNALNLENTDWWREWKQPYKAP